MKQIRRIEFQDNLVVIRFDDDSDPKWIEDRVAVVNWRRNKKVERLCHVGYHAFALFLENPDLVEGNDEVLQEWLGRLFNEQPEQGHDRP